MACPPRESFQIGWICALPIEFAAALEMLDENFGLLDSQEISDSNTYTLGRIGQHYVVIACLPAGQYGNTSATTVANNMLRTFSKSLRVGFMVGVGGGIPSKARDVRLGDVVVSCPEGTIGGVVQYDMGKVVSGGRFNRTGSLNSPPRPVLTALSSLRAAEFRDEPRFLEYLTRATERNARTRKNFGRPNAEQDRLFKPEHDHPATAESCDSCLAVWEETRSERESSDPQSHYGIIASGNSVVKDACTREQLRLETGALCFEMEAAGLMLDYPCIVIRGICDYADSHKNKCWQGYAALVAASYAKELLGYIPVGQVSQESLAVDMCKELKEELQETNKRLDSANKQREQHHREKTSRALTTQQQRCHQIFKISNYAQQKDINPSKAERTCQWALQSDEYIRWLQSRSNDLLWVSADPGCGKSVLAKSLVDDYLTSSSSELVICYFFFKDNEEQNTLARALCAILHQLFSQRSDLLHHAMPSWEKNGESLQQEVDELWRIFITATSTSTELQYNTVCIFDALDECREADQRWLIQKLKDFHSQPVISTRPTCLKFLLTSRPYRVIQHSFQDITDSFPHLHLKGEEENDQIHREIDLVVKIRVEELARLAQLPSYIQQRLEQQLLQMEHRTYLWLYLAMDDIQQTFQNSVRPAEESIRLIPASVNAAYVKILGRVPSGQVDIVKKILQIIVAARRPLTTSEMAMALDTASRPRSRVPELARIDPVHLNKKLRQLCGLFVFVNNSKIYLIHQTARDFLIGKEITETTHSLDPAFPWRLRDPEEQMAHICLRYLSMDGLETKKTTPFCDVQSFLEYSAVYWPDHVRNMSSTESQELQDLLHQVYNTTAPRFSLWFPTFWKVTMPWVTMPSPSAIHLAALNGHQNEVLYLLGKDKRSVNFTDTTGSFPLTWASLKGHYDVVRLMITHGADINARGGDYGSALVAACSEGHYKVVQLLLERGADLNAQGGYYGNALQAACSKGHNEILYMLLEHGANVNADRGLWGNALYESSSRGHTKTVQMLLRYGAEVNIKGGKYGSALQAANFEGHDEIVQILLEHGADVNASDVLQTACSEGHDEIVQMLLEHEANSNAQGGDYGSPLHAACFEGHVKIVQMLLEHRADVNAQGGYYGNPLQATCVEGYHIIVQMLLEHGADVNAQGGYFGNALQATCFEGNDEIVQTLLDHGADANAQGGTFGNALQAACSDGHVEIVQMLLEHGADANSQGGTFNESALQAACSQGNVQIVQMLLEHGADADVQGRTSNRSGLQAACSQGNVQIVQKLLEHGADANAQGGILNESALQAACYKGHVNVVQMLLEHGANHCASSYSLYKRLKRS
ncbi:hypothetical protein N7494_000349 [Penicillium frequentans]|uniref:Nucleoside phosphorylase domain-containing protein n=1 Tax=Penicillium frequentans TaxID=3151616 RepID=A0AAD6D5M8_9EURO|nr:hypothetical protein N7494_000349 [Penicillium glabrum]